MQDYESLESKGMKIFGRTQDAERWTIFCLNNFSHNTLTIGGQLHRVDGRAEFKRFWRDEVVHGFGGKNEPSNGVEIDLSPVFAGQAASVIRTISFQPLSRTVMIRDEIKGAAPGAEIRWAMATKAQVEIKEAGRGQNEARLSLNGKKLRAWTGDAHVVNSGEAVKCAFEVIPADPPKNDYDAPNPGTRILIVRAKASDSGWATICVRFSPECLP